MPQGKSSNSAYYNVTLFIEVGTIQVKAFRFVVLSNVCNRCKTELGAGNKDL